MKETWKIASRWLRDPAVYNAVRFDGKLMRCRLRNADFNLLLSKQCVRKLRDDEKPLGTDNKTSQGPRDLQTASGPRGCTATTPIGAPRTLSSRNRWRLRLHFHPSFHSIFFSEKIVSSVALSWELKTASLSMRGTTVADSVWNIPRAMGYQNADASSHERGRSQTLNTHH